MSEHNSCSSEQLQEIDAHGLHYRDLNARIRQALRCSPCQRLILRRVCGQRYIGTGLRTHVRIEIHGTPGNDLGAFMDGPTIVVHGNAQDGSGNTLNSGEIIVHGRAGDITGYAMRGGRIFVRDGVGYRAGIHMKEYGERRPALVIGGTAQPFLGEYMAGGVVLLLGLNLGRGEPHRTLHVGTGMHGGVIYLRGAIEDWQLGREVGRAELDGSDWLLVEELVRDYVGYFGGDTQAILKGPFVKLYPRYLRPYGSLYAY
jgi:glutamate synthase domain-containing protein 3